MPAHLLYDAASGFGSVGRARARRDQVIAMTPRVIEETEDRLVVRCWFSDEICTWRRVGDRKSDLFELLPAGETDEGGP